MPKIIGKKIRKIRLEEGFSQDDMEDLISIPRETISRYENSERDIFMKDLVMLSVALGDPRDFAELTEIEIDAWTVIVRNLASTYKDMYGLETLIKEIT